jgi:antitoxin ParD1/3/4
MARVEKISIAVTPEMASTMRELVASGEYASTSELLREALRDWSLRRAQRAQAVAELGRLWDEGLVSGPADDGEDAFARIRARLVLPPTG